MKIAVASSNGKIINLHFGDADRFIIFELKDGEGEFSEIREKNGMNIDNHQERWLASIDLVEDCKAVLCNKIGKEPTIELIKLGIKPIKLDCNVKEAVKSCAEHLVC